MVTCECGHKNPGGRDFCQSCNRYLGFVAPTADAPGPPGTDPAKPGDAPGVDGTGAALSTVSGGDTPPSTGVPTTTDQMPKVVIAPVAKPIAAFPERPGSDAWRQCLNCSTSNEANRTFCKQCGETLPVLQVEAPPAPDRSWRPRWLRNPWAQGLVAVAIGIAIVLMVPSLRDLLLRGGDSPQLVQAIAVRTDADSLAPSDDVCGIDLGAGLNALDAVLDGLGYTYWATESESPTLVVEFDGDPIRLSAIGVYNGIGGCPEPVTFSAMTSMTVSYLAGTDEQLRKVGEQVIDLETSRDFRSYSTDSTAITALEISFRSDAGQAGPATLAELEFFR